MQFNVEEENLICLYHNADRRRTMAKLHAALPDMDGEMAALARQTLAKLDTMTDADFEARAVPFHGRVSKARSAGRGGYMASASGAIFAFMPAPLGNSAGLPTVS